MATTGTIPVPGTTPVPTADPSAPAAPTTPQTQPPSSRRSTPGRMIAGLTILLVIGVAFGAVAVVGIAQRNANIAHIRGTSGPLQVDATALYRSLSDADATEAAAFLAAGAEPTALRNRYLADISAASDALAQASAGGIGTAALQRLNEGLPIYTGLVETARADNRLGLPLGAAYLREASGEMRTVLLPAAVELYDAEAAALDDDRGAAEGVPWLAIVLGVLVLVLLVRAQRSLARRTHRVFNIGLLSATLALTAAIVWLFAAWGASTADLHTSDVAGSARVGVLANARIDALRARADESLTLVARGNDPSFDSDYTAMTKALTEDRGLLTQAMSGPADTALTSDVDAAQKAITTWSVADNKMRQANNDGDYAQAVFIATGSAPNDEPTLFAAVDQHLDAAMNEAESQFKTATQHAAGATAAAPYGVGLLALLALAAMALGYRRRIAEYR